MENIENLNTSNVTVNPLSIAFINSAHAFKYI